MNDITLREAQKISGPRAFHLMVKPVGSLCNLNCSYCYYLDKSEIYGGKEPVMSLEMLETVVREYMAANEVSEVQFNWHGGEPLLAGIDFYRKAVELEKKYAGGKTVLNTIQTNGTLISPEWARFLKENDFLVGISIDGPSDVHDRYRSDRGGRPTFERVLHGLECLAAEGVPFNTMTTVNHCSEGRGLEVYQFLKSLGSRYMQFMPVVEHVKYPLNASGKPMKSARPYIVEPSEEGAVISPWSVDSLAFGKFMTEIFDYWVRNDVGKCFVGLFDATLSCWLGLTPGICVYGQMCADNAVIEHNGDVYPCDHFVYPGCRLGNIVSENIAQMMDSEAMTRFGFSKRTSLPRECRVCKWNFACGGECPKHRFSRTEKGNTGLNALCEGYKYFFSHSSPYMERMRDLVLSDLAPALVIPWARTH